MELKYKDMLKALSAIEDERRIPEDVILEALKEAMCKAYKKDAELQDITVEAEINDKAGTIDIYQLYTVTNEDDIEDDELEISFEEANEIKPGVQLGEMVRRKVEITSMSRAAASLARNVMRQKIREAEKVTVYSEYIDQLNDMVMGIVESVKDKFTLVNLGRTVAMMPKSGQIPGEHLFEGDKVRVVITEVNKETKGSQVLVSRSDPMLVKRLFEKEVPEIYQGIVEIKAIARDAGERTKMAVTSYNSEIDPIGACIGQRGARVQEIIEELHGEKIDIFLWSDDITKLVKNALAPAEIEAVIPGEDDRALTVVVAEDQLSLAIGRKGKNARLAVKLCNCKIDIKTRKDLEEQGYDYEELLEKAEERRLQMQKETELRNKLAREAEEEKKRQEAIAELEKQRAESGETIEETEDIIPEEMAEIVSERIHDELTAAPEETVEESEETIVVEEITENADVKEVVEETVVEEVKPVEPVVENKPKKHKADLEAIAQNNDYVSVFEKLANTSKPKQQAPARRKKRKNEDDEIKVRNNVLEQQLRKNMDTSMVKPVYTEEELEEIERQRIEEEESQYDIDYDEYEDYYNDEDNN